MVWFGNSAWSSTCFYKATAEWLQQVLAGKSLFLLLFRHSAHHGHWIIHEEVDLIFSPGDQWTTLSLSWAMAVVRGRIFEEKNLTGTRLRKMYSYQISVIEKRDKMNNEGRGDLHKLKVSSIVYKPQIGLWWRRYSIAPLKVLDKLASQISLDNRNYIHLHKWNSFIWLQCPNILCPWEEKRGCQAMA